MFRVIAIFILLIAVRADAAPAFANLDEYVRSLPLVAPKQQSVQAGGPAGRLFGIAYGTNGDDRKAVVFVLARGPGGSLEEVSRSPAFDFQDPSGRTDVEIVQAPSSTRFSIQVNSRTVCGVSLNILRFSETSTGWVLAGNDSSEPTCGKDGEVLVKASVSTNFLTGDRVEKAYDEGKLVSVRRLKLARRPIPLTQYQMQDALLPAFAADDRGGGAHSIRPTDIPKDAPRFQDYVAELYVGANAAPDVSSEARSRRYRTQLKDWAREQPNFAGHYILATWGCGTGCTEIAVIDAMTGKVFHPQGVRTNSIEDVYAEVLVEVKDGERRADFGALRYRADSRLLMLFGTPDGRAQDKGISYFVWEDERMRRVRFVGRASGPGTR